MVSKLPAKFARTVCLIFAVVATPKTHGGEAEQKLVDAGREQFVRVRSHTTMQYSGTQNVERFFNAQSCAECHILGGVGGAGPNRNNVQLINFPTPAVDVEKTPLARTSLLGESIFPELQATGNRFVPIATDGIVVLPRRGTSSDYAEQRLSIMRRIAPELPEVAAATPAQTKPRFFVCGNPGISSAIEERNTPALFGLGLIAAIPQSEIDAIAASQPKEIRGRSPRLRTGGIGRFGWKAQTATLADFNEGACAVELGLKTAKFNPAEQFRFRSRTPGSRGATRPQASLVDITTDDLAALNAYVAALPKPVQVVDWNDERDARQGEIVFHNTGCASCHVRDIGNVAGIYSDLLLHSIGTAGSIVYYGSPVGPPPQSFDIVDNTEIRTPPLWGVADSAPYLHDGGAATLEQAISRHAEQAEQSMKRYRESLSDLERAQLITFLKSLRAPEALEQPPRKVAAARR